MDNRFNRFLIGSFVIVLVAALAVLVLWLGLADRRQGYELYVARFSDSVSGLSAEASIKFRGVEVGRVQQILLDPHDPTRVRVVMAIAPDAPIRTDTVAVLSSLGITGLAYIELTGGRKDSPKPVTRPGEDYPEIATGPSLFTRIDIAITHVMTELSATSNRIDVLIERLANIASDDNMEVAAEILRNVRDLSGYVLADVDKFTRTMDSIERAADSFATSTDDLPSLIRRVDAAVLAFEDLSHRIAATAEVAVDLSSTANEEIGRWSETLLPRLSALTAELTLVSRTLNRALVGIEENPNLLLYGRPEPAPGPGE
jgi:phospholipid/cholesterol/gamma-HCH transport system substrate-binding protein